ncbi:MAG TPA: hypothetical protein VGB45_11755 [Abditibacterium sp.]|jgi:hypothetical protein
MGYELHITRAQTWRKNQGQEITASEWNDLIELDTELKLAGLAEVVSPSNQTLRYENPLLAVWLGHPQNIRVWLDFRRGNIVVNNPDEATIAKMHLLSRQLNAHVQGDEGEIYS